MSSAYLTLENMNMIERLLIAAREIPHSTDREAANARFLMNRVQRGARNEGELRRSLDTHIREIKERETSRRPTERGALGRAIGALFASKFPGRKPSQLIAQVLAPRLSRNEAQRRFNNDTDGRQRRQDEIKRRNQMH